MIRKIALLLVVLCIMAMQHQRINTITWLAKRLTALELPIWGDTVLYGAIHFGFVCLFWLLYFWGNKYRIWIGIGICAFIQFSSFMLALSYKLVLSDSRFLFAVSEDAIRFTFSSMPEFFTIFCFLFYDKMTKKNIPQ